MTPWPKDKLRNPTRLNVDIETDDLQKLRSVVPIHGILSLVIQTFIHDIANHIRLNGYTYTDSDTVLTYLRYRADSCFTGQASPRDVGAGVEGVHPNPTLDSNVIPSAGKTAKNRQRTEKIKEVYKKRLARQRKEGKEVDG